MNPPPKPLIFHYHLFKNAGTSVDEILKRNFPKTWSEAEFTGRTEPGKASDRVLEYLSSRPDLDAFSSHTALLPAPELADRTIIPIIFVRHPIDRLKSAYSFERKQIADTEGSKLAKSTDFVGYIRALMEQPRNRQAHNFQTYRFSTNFALDQGTELERALRTVESLPFVGLVEKFDQSLVCLEATLTKHFKDFKTHSTRKNVSQKVELSLDEKLLEIERELGTDLYDELTYKNNDDIVLCHSVTGRF